MAPENVLPAVRTRRLATSARTSLPSVFAPPLALPPAASALGAKHLARPHPGRAAAQVPAHCAVSIQENCPCLALLSLNDLDNPVTPLTSTF